MKIKFDKFFVLEIICFCLIYLPVSLYAWPVPDTGQTTCYDATGNAIPCPSPGDFFYGQDGCYNINPMSYTKLDISGNELPDDATSWIMVRDNVTSLIWEVKRNKDGVEHYDDPRDADNTYTWYDSNPATNGGYAGTPGDGTDTEDFINALNDENFGGYSDWHLPSNRDLLSIPNYSLISPAIKIEWFPDNQSAWYWSSITNKLNNTRAGGVYFHSGREYSCEKDDTGYVLAVRGEQVAPRFVDNGNGTVSDVTNGLMWQQATASDRYTWLYALAYCEGLKLAGYNDWRLPSIRELYSLVDYSHYDPAVSEIYFPDTVSPVSRYSSSTTYANDNSRAWYVNLGIGHGSTIAKGFSNEVRAVRGGQSTSLSHSIIISPRQASSWKISSLMPIRWETGGLGLNVKISLSRQGGSDGTFEIIFESTPNDGQQNWVVSGFASVNCVVKIEQADNPANWATEGLFVITIKKGDINNDATLDLADEILALQIVAGITPNQNIYKTADVNNDGIIGMEEVIYILEKVVDTRE